MERISAWAIGDRTKYTGLERSAIHRWFIPTAAERATFPTDARAHVSAVMVSHLRRAIVQGGEDAFTRELVTSLLAGSAEFREVWARHEVNRPIGPLLRL